jgi:hypothetical protein
MGAVSADEFTGVTEATTVPDCPGVRVSVVGATEISKSGVVVAWAWTLLVAETDARWVVSPA